MTGGLSLQVALKHIQKCTCETQFCFSFRFNFFSLDATHIVSIARGPTLDVGASYRELAWSNNRNTIFISPTKFDSVGSSQKSKVQDQAILEENTELSPCSPLYYTIVSEKLPNIEKKVIVDLLPDDKVYGKYLSLF